MAFTPPQAHQAPDCRAISQPACSCPGSPAQARKTSWQAASIGYDRETAVKPGPTARPQSRASPGVACVFRALVRAYSTCEETLTTQHSAGATLVRRKTRARRSGCFEPKRRIFGRFRAACRNDTPETEHQGRREDLRASGASSEAGSGWLLGHHGCAVHLTFRCSVPLALRGGAPTGQDSAWCASLQRTRGRST